MALQGNFSNFWYGGTGKEVLIDYLSVQGYFFHFNWGVFTLKFSKKIFACSEFARVAQNIF